MDQTNDERIGEVIDLNGRRKSRPPIKVLEAIQVVWNVGTADKGHIFTRGMEKFGKPNIQVFDVPLWLYPVVTMVLNQVADYLLNHGGEIKSGESMKLDGPYMPFVFKDMPFVFKDTSDGDDRWLTITDDHLVCHCGGDEEVPL